MKLDKTPACKRFFDQLSEANRQNNLSVIDDDSQISYENLSKRLREQAKLWEGEPGNRQIRPLVVSPTIESVVALLGAWFAGQSIALLSNDSEEQSRQKAALDSLVNEEAINNDDQVVALCTSGTTGSPKWVIHPLNSFLQKYTAAKKTHTTLGVIGVDHIGGLDVLLYCLASGGTLVLSNRLDEAGYVTQLIRKHGVTLIATTPTWIKWRHLREPSLKPIPSVQALSLGGEPIDEQVLSLVKKILPSAHIIQKYGLTELSVLKSRTHPDDPQLIAFDPSVDYRIVDGFLEIKRLLEDKGEIGTVDNQDEWFSTGDRVEKVGDWLRITGRASQAIISGGEQISKVQIAAVLNSCEEVVDYKISGMPNILLGQTVAIELIISDGVEETNAIQSVRQRCRELLPKSHWPTKVKAVKHLSHSARYKRLLA